MGARFRTIALAPPAVRAPLDVLPADPFFAEVLFDQLPDVVFFVKNTQGQYSIVNQTLVERCGARSKADLLGRTAEEVFPAPLGASYAEQDRRVIASGEPIRDKLELHLFSDHSRGWCLTHKIPLLDVDGAIVGMAGLSRDLHRPEDHRTGYRGLAESVEYLQSHFDESIRIENLADVAKMPVDRYGKMVKRAFHLTPHQLLVRTRVDAAARLLVETDSTVAEIAYACGYSDHSAFSRQFGSATGLTPTQFREAGRGASGR